MWTQAHQDELERFAVKFPPPIQDDACRVWTRKLAEQFAFRFNAWNIVWGTKRADAGRPPSTDVICTASPFVGYDVLINQGRPEQEIAVFPGAIDLMGQVYIPVTAHDYLGAVTPVPPKPPAHECPVLTYPTYEALGGDEGGKKITRQLEADFLAAGRSGLDGDCGAWQQRVSYDFLTGKVTPVEAAIAKHRPDWLKALGL